MKKVLAGIGAIAIAIALTGTVVAAEQTTTQTQNKTQAQTQLQNKEQLRLMEKAGGLKAGTIEAMRKEHHEDGEIVIAGALSKASNQPLSRIMTLKKQGMGWGEIAQKYNLKLGDVMKSVYANINAYENHAKQVKDKNSMDAANQIRNEVQQQERMNMQEMMQHRNEQMQHEMNMNEHMNEQHGNMPDMNGMHGK